MRSSRGSRLTIRTTLRYAVLPVIFLTSTCGSPPDKPTFPPIERPIVLEHTNPGEESRCACETSQGVYLRNVSDTTRLAHWYNNTKDTLSGELLEPIGGSGTIAPEQRQFVGCTIHAPATQCRFQAIYRLGQVYTPRASFGEEAAVFGPTVAPSIASCVAWCSPEAGSMDPFSGQCLPLGPRMHKAIAPLRELVSAAKEGDGIVQREAYLARYGLEPSDDQCRRGDIVIEAGRVTNEGEREYCELKSASVPRRVFEALGIDDLLGNELGLTTILPMRLEAIAAGNMSLFGATVSDVAIFDLNDAAPVLRFSGVDSENLTAMFGGSVLATARTQVNGGDARTIIATTNGCIAVDEP